MRYRFCSFIRILAFSLTLLFTTEGVSALGFKWLTTTHDFGAFSEDMEQVRCTFKAVNTDSVPLVVTSARANCGCTRPQYPRLPIQPGDTLDVSVAYNAVGRPGRFDKKVYVTDGNGTTYTLTIVGTVIGKPISLSGRYPVIAGMCRLSSTVLTFGDVKKGRIGRAVLKGYNPNSDTITPSVINVPPYLDLIVRPKKVAPGDQFVISATATTDRCKDWGVVQDSFYVSGDPLSSYLERISTVMIVSEDFSNLTPDQLERAPKARISEMSVDFGSFSRSAKAMTRTFKIENSGASPLLIRKIDSPDRSLAIKCRAKTIKPGKSATVTVHFTPSAMGDSELLNSRITVITNDPAAPQQIVRVVGEPK